MRKFSFYVVWSAQILWSSECSLSQYIDIGMVVILPQICLEGHNSLAKVLSIVLPKKRPVKNTPIHKQEI